MPRKIICTIPQHVCVKDQILAAEQKLRRTYRDHFGEQKAVTILWCGIPEGQSYVAGSMDDIYIAMVEVEEGIDQLKREQAMMDMTRCLSKAFDIDFEKPLVSAMDSSRVREYLTANRNRLRWHKRPGFVLGTLWHAIQSRSREGFACIRANL